MVIAGFIGEMGETERVMHEHVFSCRRCGLHWSVVVCLIVVFNQLDLLDFNSFIIGLEWNLPLKLAFLLMNWIVNYGFNLNWN